MIEAEKTKIITIVRDMPQIADGRVHCLEFVDEFDEGARRHFVGPLGLRIGRTPPADIVIPDSAVSRNHCYVAFKDGGLHVTDLNSTNGTFVDQERVSGVVPLPVGSVLQVGRRTLKHEWRTKIEIDLSEEIDRELQRAASYVQSLLPLPSREGPIRADWYYQPSTKLGGDAFGYGQLSEHLYVGYLVDVSGHGAGAAMHAVSVMNQLRHHALPGADMSQPAEVLAALNRDYQMDAHDGMYFTIWYGVYDVRNRRLDFASAGHHPSFLVPPDRSCAVPAATRNLFIGAMPGLAFKQGSIDVPPGTTLYMFSDGCFEIVDRAGKQWGLADFVPLLTQPPVEELAESQRLYQAVRRSAQPGPLDDDFSLVAIAFS